MELNSNFTHPAPGDEIVISGISGQFPNCRNVEDYGQNIKNKLNLCDDDERRFKHTISEVPKVTGKMVDIEFFDTGFFGIHELHANSKDVTQRLVLERTHEAILDAGIAPEDLIGTNTGVYNATCALETQKHSLFRNLKKGNSALLGVSRSILAQYISYYYKLNGPSISVDSACSSGMLALNDAYKAIREGRCNKAIVCGTNVPLNAKYTLQFARLGVLNSNGECRPFDDDASGYTRSEAICVLILEKYKDCKRAYAQVVHTKTNTDGFKKEGITHPSNEMQMNLLKEIYSESGVPLDEVGYFEAHGTGTVIGDFEELTGIDSFFNTASRKGKPLIIGSVKGNIGHSEPVAALASIIKVLYGMENDLILPNIHYTNPRKDIEGLIQGRLIVATENIPWPENAAYCGINSFGFGGANGHVILKRIKNTKVQESDKLPRLVCFSGRTKESIFHIQNYLKRHEINNDFVSLLHSAYRKNIPNNVHRGYSILSHNENSKNSSKYCFKGPDFIHLYIGDSDCMNLSTFTELSKLPIFQNTVNRFMQILAKHEINISSKSLHKFDTEMFYTCMQLGILAILSALNIIPTFISGNSYGDLIAAYVDETLTFEQVVISICKLKKIFSKLNEENIGQLELEMKQKLIEIITDGPKKATRYLNLKSNPFEFGTAEYFFHNIKHRNSLGEIDKGVVLVLTGDERHSIQLLKYNMNLKDLLEHLGSLYELGLELDLFNLYPKCSWPVQRGTPIISPLIKWDHNKIYDIPRFDEPKSFYGEQRVFEYNLKEHSHSYMNGHVIDGRKHFPATAYIMCIVEMFTSILGNDSMYEQILQFSNIKFLKPTTFGNDGIVKILVTLNYSGSFEISENGVSVVTGQIVSLKEDVSFDIQNYVESDIKLAHNDIYKEFRLRGYNYSGKFCGIQEFCGNRGLVEWSDNFVAFLDNMMQLYILQEINRALYITAEIANITLNFASHKKIINNFERNQSIPVFIDKNTKSIKTASIEMNGLRAAALTTKKQLHQPILETYKFIPNEMELSIDNAFRVNTQIILENRDESEVFKVLEQIDEQREPFAPNVQNALDRHPLILYDIKIISDLNYDMENKCTIVQEAIELQANNLVFIGTNLLIQPKKMKTALKTLLEGGFLITLETHIPINIPTSLISITKFKVSQGFLYLLSRRFPAAPCLPIIEMSKDFKWLDPLKKGLNRQTEIIIYSENDRYSGIMGFINCLRRETKNKIYSFFLNGAPKFNENSNFYKNQLEKHLTINVFKNGQWGTYRHMLLDTTALIQTEHCLANVNIISELNSLQWISGPLTKNTANVNVYYSAINYKDLMTASRKVAIESIPKNRLEREGTLGLEFSGINESGERVMGIVKSGGIGSLLKAEDLGLIWKVPKHWSLQEAVTVPVVYATVLISFQLRANMKRSESILIHSGTGGIGLSAINVALHYGLTIYTTVGTKEKRDFLIKTYPEIDPLNIGNSRDMSFEKLIFKRTNGRGVNYVLNSLSEEMLLASVRCLSKNGTFFEIGKFDIYKNSDIDAEFQNKGISFKGVTLDRVFEAGTDYSNKIQSIIQEGIDGGIIKPLPTTCFQMNQLQEAFRYVGSGKHIGKVIFKIRDENIDKQSETQLFSAIPRVFFDPQSSYIIVGGLGGFGLELAEWMVIRGARKLIFSSRNGLKNGYQKLAIRKLNMYGAYTKIVQDNVTTVCGCKNILKTANSIGPIGGIFNLAVVIRDGIFENLNEDDFKLVFAPKSETSMLLDQESKTNYPDIKYFVLFSSISSGKGNIGQTNYGMTNSINERLCERRRAEGLPALAIQWGAIGDVGIVAEMQTEQNEIVIGGTLQQRIISCLDVLDQLLHSQEAVVSSMIIAEKSVKNESSDKIVNAALNVLGIRDIKTISPHATLAELGMDSIMAMECKHLLETNFDIFLSSNDIKALTINKLIEMTDCEVESKVEVNLVISNSCSENSYKSPKIKLVTDIKEREM